ncbi:MAG: hypothetical protein R3D01_11515 [Hyphomicrobiales bacterium]
MATWKTVLIALAGSACLTIAAHAADSPDETAGDQEQAAAPKCLEAAVNPVTGYAVCVNPRGAPVEPPPPEALDKPCKSRPHDDDPFTVYERYSACD